MSFETVTVSQDKYNPAISEKVQRLNPEALPNVSQIVHHPTKLVPLAHLSCSCGYEGTVKLESNSEPSPCPNCGSLTVHPDHVTDSPVTFIHFKNGDKHKMVSSPKVEVKPSETPVTPVVTQSDIAAEVNKQLSPVLNKMDAILNAISQNEKPKESEAK